MNQVTTTILLFMKMFSYARQTVGASRSVLITTASWIKIPLEAMHFQSPDANSEGCGLRRAVELNALSALFDKKEAYAESKRIKPVVLLNE